MHKLIAASTILEHELSELRLLVEQQTGVVLDCPNSALATHIADYVEAQGLGSSSTLLERLRSPDQDPSGLPSLLDGLVNTNTGFFRHPGALNAADRASRQRAGAAHLERGLRQRRRDILYRHGRLRCVQPPRQRFRE